MIVTTFVVNSESKKESFEIVPIGDIHYGTKNCEKEKFLELIKYIKNKPNCYWIGMGDMIEAINYSDKRFDPANVDVQSTSELSNLAVEQLSYICDKLTPIRHKCLGMLTGNHEETIHSKYHIDVTGTICQRLKVTYLGYTAFVKFVMRLGHKIRPHSQQVTIFATHGFGGGSYQVGSDLNKCANLARAFDADIYLFGHCHKKASIITESIGVAANENRIISQKKLFALTGTLYNPYKTANSSYAEKKCYPMGHLGMVRISIKPFKHNKIEGKDYALRPDIHISE